MGRPSSGTIPNTTQERRDVYGTNKDKSETVIHIPQDDAAKMCLTLSESVHATLCLFIKNIPF